MTVQYFMDEANMYEATVTINNLPYVDRTNREMERYHMYILAQVNNSKKIKPTDILKFAWDDEQPQSDTNISNDDINRLKEKAEKIREVMFKNINQ